MKCFFIGLPEPCCCIGGAFGLLSLPCIVLKTDYQMEKNDTIKTAFTMDMKDC